MKVDDLVLVYGKTAITGKEQQSLWSKCGSFILLQVWAGLLLRVIDVNARKELVRFFGLLFLPARDFSLRDIVTEL